MAPLTPSGQHFGRALALHREGRLAEAAQIYRELSAAGGAFAVDARINLGALLDEDGRHEEALLQYAEALSIRSGDHLALNNMGNSLLKLGRFAEAAERFREALEQAPGCLEARLALGAALQRGGDAAAASACFRGALEQDPDCAEAHWNLSLALLLSGDFQQGWLEYQWRWRRDSFTSPGRGFEEPSWDGSPLAGRRILVHGEQGFGDTIQFARYLPMVAALGGTVIAECQSATLTPLLRRVPGVSAVFVMGEALPPFDLQVPLLSLPYLFGTTLERIPNQVPYLCPPPERLAHWRDRVSGRESFKVGIAWAGKAVPDPFRSCSLAALAPLADIPGVALYSLQLGRDREGEGAPRPELIDLTPSIHDFGDTAALISQLDLVLSVDTSVAHLAGALGKPVWLLLPMAGDWRWLLERDDSPWYPTMRLFRQKRQGEWGVVIEQVTEELSAAVWDFLEKGAAGEPFNGWRLQLCGAFLAAHGRHREASVRFTKAAQLMPGSWEPHYALAESLQHLGNLTVARESLEAALAVRGDLALLHEALGIVRQLQGDPEGALQSYREALGLDPDLLKARFNLATAWRETGRFAEALQGFGEVIRRAPGHADAHWNLAVLLLLTGDLASGWREFPWRFQKSAPAPTRRHQEHPGWDGSSLAGRSILLYGEQGAGDTLQFVRYAPLVAGLGGRVLIEVQSRALLPLVATVAGVEAVFAAGDPPPPFELQASLMDLPAIFRTDLRNIPADVPYLRADPALLAASRELIPQDGSFRVGVVWHGNPAHGNDANRSLPPGKLAPLASLQGASFYSLQLGEGAQAEPSSPLQPKDLSPQIRDFADTAALAAQLDLVLTVDTSVAHLCGALGLRVWLLLPFVPDWRWLLTRDDSPWYPTMRLFRQQSPGDWEGVVHRVREALAQAAAAHGLERTPGGAPVQAELLNNLGCQQDGSGRQLEAIESYRRAIALNPDFAAPHYNMGNSLNALGRGEEAIASYRHALAIDPVLPQGWHNLALSLQGAGRLDEAKEALQQAIFLAPGYLEARHNLGELCHARGKLEAAEACFRKVLALDPRYLPSWNALGITLQVQDRLDEALDCYLTALSIKPGYLHALNNLGALSRALGQVDRAVHCYRQVLAQDPDYADAHWNLGLVQLLLGQFEAGWQGYQWRFRKVDPIPEQHFPQPLWDGAPLKGRVILLHAEQGFGDTLQFVRYVPLLARSGAVVLVQCQSQAIAPVIATVTGVARVLVRGEPLPQFDCHAPLMSLPYLCGTRLDTIPSAVPYLCADPELIEAWGARITGNGLRVGLVWAGRKSYKDDGKRSLSLPRFAPLARVPGVRFYALQVGEGSEQIASPPAGLELVDLGQGIRNFADSAACLAQLDLVISADTAVAHLAGALGKPVWVLLPMACDWRWLLERDDSPWYPSARLFRQERRGDWQGVLERVARQLAELAGGGASPPSSPV